MMKQLLIKNWWLFVKGNYKYAILMAGAFLCPCYFYAQNLVPNPSFEESISCPYQGGQINFSKYWFEPYLCTADYFNVCNSGDFGVPENVYGYQYAKQGNAYSGMIVYDSINFYHREFIEIKLNSPLEQGKKYCIEFYISLHNGVKYAIKTMGCILTQDSLIINTCDEQISFLPQIENTESIITDTMNWVIISGEFTASGGEQFLTIGNFRNDSNSYVSIINNNAPNPYISYYYIDDISVTLCDTVGVEEFQTSDYRLQIYPNPASGNVTITATGGDKIIITDIAGRKIKEYKPSGNQLKIKLDEYENGIYFIALYNGQRLVAAEKLCVAK